jgi:hypothetical protein
MRLAGFELEANRLAEISESRFFVYCFRVAVAE